MIDLVAYHPDMVPDLLAIWHAADRAAYPIMPELFAANTTGDPSFQCGDLLVATLDGVPVGFALTKRFTEDVEGCEPFRTVGYLALLAVAPEHQGQGIGTELVRRAEQRLGAQGARKVVVGGSFHHFMPGVPRGDRLEATFARWGYTLGKPVWDVRRDLRAAPPRPAIAPVLAANRAQARPLSAGEAPQLQEFLRAAFAGRWPRDVAFHLEHGGRLEDVMGLWVDQRLAGFAQLHFPGGPGARRWAGFEPGIAALGPIGVGADQQGKGLGLALLVAGLDELARRGAGPTVIDWTDLLAFYGRCGFEPWLRYVHAEKSLA